MQFEFALNVHRKPAETLVISIISLFLMFWGFFWGRETELLIVFILIVFFWIVFLMPRRQFKAGIDKNILYLGYLNRFKPDQKANTVRIVSKADSYYMKISKSNIKKAELVKKVDMDERKKAWFDGHLHVKYYFTGYHPNVKLTVSKLEAQDVSHKSPKMKWKDTVLMLEFQEPKKFLKALKHK